eukprot:1237433-Rhodomonas_salina.1
MRGLESAGTRLIQTRNERCADVVCGACRVPRTPICALAKREEEVGPDLPLPRTLTCVQSALALPLTRASGPAGLRLRPPRTPPDHIRAGQSANSAGQLAALPCS